MRRVITSISTDRRRQPERTTRRHGADRRAAGGRRLDALDAIGLQAYFGWYAVHFDLIEKLLANSDPGERVIVTETRVDAAPGDRGAGRVLPTEAWQAEIYRRWATPRPG